ncbi:VRR-NUC domain-containing protein, partial [Staphylococcus pseudintermedius]|nr:VRR-NUC domain-containing protein [Staphylococcus pseudintermedius]MDT0896860.1 VRR-NUC domain-containing protein [Staphylococcus pseudintermedius]
MTEQDIQNLIRIAVSKNNMIFRANVGKVRTADGRIFDTGLP